MDWGTEYVAAWNAHDVEAVIALFATNCEYIDMPHALSWEGHAGVRTMFESTVSFLPDFQFTRHGGFRDDERYAMEWTLSGTTSGKKVSYRVGSVGRFDDDLRIVEHRDYWNAKDLAP